MYSLKPYLIHRSIIVYVLLILCNKALLNVINRLAIIEAIWVVFRFQSLPFNSLTMGFIMQIRCYWDILSRK
jgi:hypothetical protein